MPYLAAISPHRGHLLFHHLSHVVAKTGPHLGKKRRSCFECRETLNLKTRLEYDIHKSTKTYLVISCHVDLSLSPVHLVGS